MNSLQQQLARLLGRREKLASQDCEAQLAAIAERLDSIDCRSLEIERNAGGRPGPVLRAALETGSPQDVVRLEDEARLLDAERASLIAQREALQERRAAAIAEEAVPQARETLRKLPALVSKAERLAAELAQTRATLEGDLDALTQARVTAKQGGQEPPAMSTEVFDRLRSIFGWTDEAGRVRREALTDQRDPRLVEAARRDAERHEREERERVKWSEAERKRVAERNAARGEAA